MIKDPAPPLRGLGVLIIRPQRQAERLAELIAAVGGDPVVFPTIEIQPITDDASLRVIAGKISEYSIAIFVSANAVEQGMPYLVSVDTSLPQIAFAAIGEATKKALQGFGVNDVLVPVTRYDSEGLLELPQMQDVAGKRIAIFRGEGGREVLAEVLRRRGAIVDYAVCYRRLRPAKDSNLLQSRWQTGNIQAVSAMSAESLTNLYDILDDSTRELLVRTPIFVPHTRIAEAAKELGLSNLHVTGPSDAELIKGLSLLPCRTT